MIVKEETRKPEEDNEITDLHNNEQSTITTFDDGVSVKEDTLREDEYKVESDQETDELPMYQNNDKGMIIKAEILNLKTNELTTNKNIVGGMIVEEDTEQQEKN